MRTISIVVAALAVLALGGVLSACGGPGGNAARKHLAAVTSSAPAPVTSSPVTSPPVRSSPAPSFPGRSSPPSASPSPPVAVLPHVAVVRLGAGFSPGSLRLSVGQQFLLTVSPSVQARGLAAPGQCASGAAWTTGGGLLSVRCASGGYLYTAEHPGSATISATVGPRCSPGQMCPQWLTEPRLQVTIT